MDGTSWDNFFVTQAAASAALLGLLFVSMSLNLSRILAFRFLPDRAVVGMMLLLAILQISSLHLVPGQSARLLGAEVLCVGLLAFGFGAALQMRAILAGGDGRKLLLFNLGLYTVATAPYLIGGGLLMAGRPVGHYWIAAAILLSLAKAVQDAWVLLVEINR